MPAMPLPRTATVRITVLCSNKSKKLLCSARMRERLFVIRPLLNLFGPESIAYTDGRHTDIVKSNHTVFWNVAHQHAIFGETNRQCIHRTCGIYTLDQTKRAKS